MIVFKKEDPAVDAKHVYTLVERPPTPPEKVPMPPCSDPSPPSSVSDLSRTQMRPALVAASLASIVAMPRSPRETPDSLRLDFESKGHISTFYAVHRPLGIIVAQHQESEVDVSPLVVNDFAFNSYAATLGIQKGSRLVRIGDRDVSFGVRYSQTKAFLNEGLQALRLWSLRLEFEKHPNGEAKIYMLQKRPLGIVFTTQAPPLFIKSVAEGSYAESLGIMVAKSGKEKWQLKKIGDVVCTKDHSCEQQLDMIRRGMQSLDPWEAGPRARDQIRGWD